jgi:hypothetical protein
MWTSSPVLLNARQWCLLLHRQSVGVRRVCPFGAGAIASLRRVLRWYQWQLINVGIGILIYRSARSAVYCLRGLVSLLMATFLYIK